MTRSHIEQKIWDKKVKLDRLVQIWLRFIIELIFSHFL